MTSRKSTNQSSETPATSERKALQINLDKRAYGTFAEIGAGQEVARHFFTVGGAAGTIAKTMSAYDMTFSDDIYGKTGRYVSRERLMSMLQHEYRLLLERLSEKRGADTSFFVFADTVSARNFQGTNECHGWMGVRFQDKPLSPPNDIVIHVRMTDRMNVLQQQALGIIGVNLLYGALYLRNSPDQFIASLLDELSIERIEVDMIEFSGPALSGIDNRLMSLKLVHCGYTNAIMFAPDGQVLQPSEVLRKRPILVARGSFRPVTHVNLDMMKCALAQLKAIPSVKDSDPVTLFEITLNNLLSEGTLNDQDFLARADTLATLGYDVLISNYPEHYALTAYFRRYTSETIGIAMGINTLMRIFDERYYQNLDGGILEGLGRLFKNTVKLFVYPMLKDEYLKLTSELSLDSELTQAATDLPEVVTAFNLHVSSQLRHLYKYLKEGGMIHPIDGFNREHLKISSRDILAKIKNHQPGWECSVPASAAAVIKQRKIFGYSD